MRSLGAVDGTTVPVRSSGHGEAWDMAISEIPASGHGSRAANSERSHSPGGPGVVDYLP